MQFRRLLDHDEAHRPFAGTVMLERIGGRSTIEKLVDGLYDRIETDAALRPLFGRDLTGERAAQKRFFVEWLGGPFEYTDAAYLPIKHRHDLLPITRELAGKWLAQFRAALDDAVAESDVRAEIFERVRGFAMALVNEGATPSALRAHPHGTCLRYRPAVESLALARRGDVRGLRALLERAPDVLASVPHAAALLQLAVLGNREDVVELLLERGVDVNKPAPIEPLVFVTPLCAARAKRRRGIEELLLARGAQDDVFTHAFTGDVERLARALEADPSLAQAFDPAVDALAITPVHHAIAGERVEALQLLLARIAPTDALRGSGRALRMAVEREHVAIAAAILSRGVGASTVGAGRWVVHPELAPMLSRAGARIDRSGSWIGLACTGNQGRKDDPELVAALLRHGARVDDRRLVGQGSDGGRATALHYAAKAGFVKTIAVLFEHGADRDVRDDHGLRPIDWLERAAKSVDRDAVRRALRAGIPAPDSSC